MKAQKVFVLFVVVVVGALMVSGFDSIMGVNLNVEDIGVIPAIFHRVIHMLYGVAIYCVGVFLWRKGELNESGNRFV